jgi:hypothetical protein
MANKMTIAEQYEAIIAKAKGVLSAEEIAFLKDRKDKHLAKNTSKKMTKIQVENEKIKAEILEFMEDGKVYTCGQVEKGLGLSSTSKASALMTQLKNDNLVIRTVEKGVAYFKKA